MSPDRVAVILEDGKHLRRMSERDGLIERLVTKAPVEALAESLLARGVLKDGIIFAGSEDAE